MLSTPQARTTGWDYASIDTHLIRESLEIRKRVFIDRMGWDLPAAHGLEFDQYDTPHARYVTVTLDGRVVAGVRLVPTTARVGPHSYMLKDAREGRLPGLPEDILKESAPVDPEIWEASRVFILPEIAREQRATVRKMLLSEMLSEARRWGATGLVSILPAWWPRLRKDGLSIDAIGPRVDIGGPHQATMIDVMNSAIV